MTFDSSFREAPAQASLLANMTLRQALDAVARATGTFYQVTGSASIVVVPDTPAKRREYTQEEMRTFYVRNADLKETVDALRVVGDLRQMSPITGTNAIIVRDTPERLAGHRPIHHDVRQGAPRARRRRRDPRGRPDEAPRIRPADRLARIARHRRGRGHQSPGVDAAEPPQPVGVGRDRHRRAGALLPAAQERQQHAHAGQPAHPHDRRHEGARQLRRGRPGAGDDDRADRRRAARTSSRRRRTATRPSA